MHPNVTNNSKISNFFVSNRTKWASIRNALCTKIKLSMAKDGLPKVLLDNEKMISVNDFGKVFLDLNKLESRMKIKEKIQKISEVHVE